MKKVDLNFDLIGLGGELIGNVGVLVASFLTTENKGDSIKMLDWAMALHKGETLSLDDSDFSTLETLIKGSERFPIIIKGTILKYLNTLK